MTKAASLSLGFILLLAAASPAQTNSPTDMAVNEAVMRQANTIVLRQKLGTPKAPPRAAICPAPPSFTRTPRRWCEQIGSGIRR